MSPAERRDLSVQYLMKQRTKMALCIQLCQANEDIKEKEKKITSLTRKAHDDINRIAKAEVRYP